MPPVGRKLRPTHGVVTAPVVDDLMRLDRPLGRGGFALTGIPKGHLLAGGSGAADNLGRILDRRFGAPGGGRPARPERGEPGRQTRPIGVERQRGLNRDPFVRAEHQRPLERTGARHPDPVTLLPNRKTQEPLRVRVLAEQRQGGEVGTDLIGRHVEPGREFT